MPHRHHLSSENIPGRIALSPVVSVLKHVHCRVSECPKRSLPASPLLPGQFNETVVETKVVPDRVLPALPVVSVVRELVHDEPVDLA